MQKLKVNGKDVYERKGAIMVFCDLNMHEAFKRKCYVERKNFDEELQAAFDEAMRSRLTLQEIAAEKQHNGCTLNDEELKALEG